MSASASASPRPANVKQRSSQNQRNMASSGVDDQRPTEDEPLLGHTGDAQQSEGRSVLRNLYLGTGVLAQAGIWVFVGIIWGAVFTHDLIFFSAHPLLNSAGILLVTQAILILQPTATQEQKVTGAFWHAGIINTGNLALIAGLVIIEVNKADHGGHFESPHAILGLVTYISVLVQWIAGASMFFFPNVYGGVAKAKALYKYHRLSGYVVLVLFLATACAATQTTYNVDILHVRLWTVIVASVVTLAGVVARVKKSKLRF